MPPTPFHCGPHFRGDSREASNGAVAGVSFFELLVATYGGYFGGGMGIMNLAMFAVGMTDIHEMNALEIMLVPVINWVATGTFIATGAIVWPQALVIVGPLAADIPRRTTHKNSRKSSCGRWSSFGASR